MVTDTKISDKTSFVFFGSGPVAAESLELLLDTYTVEAVITKPRPKWHKGISPVIDVVERKGITAYFVSNKNELDELLEKTVFKSDLGILIDFGIIVSNRVINSFKKGIINSHFSLLPEWRGADPITFSLLSGQKTTGVSLMLLTAGMDEGPLLCQVPVAITAHDTSQSLTQKLIKASDTLLKKTINPWCNGKINTISQSDIRLKEHDAVPTYSRKIEKKDGSINWQEPAELIERKVRAFLEWPKCQTKLGDINIIVTKSHVVTTDHKQTPGKISVIGDVIMVACAADSLAIDMLKPEGRKEMSSRDFLLGYRQKILDK